MTLVMDGVVRRSALVARPQSEPVRRMAPVAPMTPLSGARTSVGMDGIRRHVPTPREVLANLNSEPAVIPAMAPAIPYDGRKLRSLAAFGLVATALVTAGVATASAATVQPTARPTTLRASTATIQPPVSPAAAAVAPTATGLQSLLDNFVAGQPGVYGIVVKNLSTGETATIDGDRVVESASIYKLFVADKIYNQIDLGKLSPAQAAGGGSGKNIADCLNAMITVSDNTCGRALGSLIGWGDQNAALGNEGYVGTSLTGTYPQTSARDVAKLFERLYDNSLNSPSSNAAFLGLLKGQLVNNRLPQGLPAGTTIAHKTGDLDGYMHDAGIVYGPKGDYVVVMMGNPGAAPSMFANLSQQLWSHFEQ